MQCFSNIGWTSKPFVLITSRYVYVVETGLYYLRIRYYSFNLTRFINTDIIVADNLFSYCSNNPIILLDIDGTDPASIITNGMIPPPETGYIPPKHGPLEKTINRIHYWVDKFGYLWSPDRLHYDHWDVKNPKDNSYINVYPDGKQRKGKGKHPPTIKPPKTSPGPKNDSPKATPNPNQSKRKKAPARSSISYSADALSNIGSTVLVFGGIVSLAYMRQIMYLH